MKSKKFLEVLWSIAKKVKSHRGKSFEVLKSAVSPLTFLKLLLFCKKNLTTQADNEKVDA